MVIALTLYNGSVLAEVFRAGINAVPRGQAEAAYAIGMRKSQVMTVGAAAAGGQDHAAGDHQPDGRRAQGHQPRLLHRWPPASPLWQAHLHQFGNQVPTAIVITGLYVAVNLVLTWIATWVQRRFVGDTKPLAVTTGDDQSTAAAGGSR